MTPDSNYLRDLGYTDDEIYGDPDDNGDEGFIGGLCARCGNTDGAYYSDRCDAYNMPLYMVARKKKCKRFSEIVYEYGE